MIDLYERLGVSRNATNADIRAAYRRLCKTAHPDAGGDAQTFHDLSVAHDTLSDPLARAQYDKTGRVIDATDNGRAWVLQAISEAINAVGAHLVKSGVTDPATVDMEMLLRGHLEKRRAECQAGAAQAEKDIATLEDMAVRFKVDDDGENAIAGLLRAQIAVIREQAAVPTAMVGTLTAALEELSRYRFDKKKVVSIPGSQFDTMWTGSPYRNGLSADYSYSAG